MHSVCYGIVATLLEFLTCRVWSMKQKQEADSSLAVAQRNKAGGILSNVGLGKLIAMGDTLNVKTDRICGKIV